MNNTSTVILAKKLWQDASTKEELKRNISAYMTKNYPDYHVVEIHKYYAVCDVGR